MRAQAHRNGSVFTIGSVQLWGGYTWYLRGDLGEAESSCVPRSRRLRWACRRRRSGNRQSSPSSSSSGRARRGTPCWTRSSPRLPVRTTRSWSTALGCACCWPRTAEEALAYADVYELHAGWKRHPRYVPWRSLKAQALDRLGRQDEAVALAMEELEIARLGIPGTVGGSLRVLGTILRTDGIEPLEEACALLEQAPARLEHAKALAALGAALRRARKPTEAREPLRRALELADVCGSQPLVDVVRAEIRHRRPPAARPPSGVRLDGERATGRRSRRRRTDQPRHRSDPTDAEDGRGSPQPRVPQAGDRIASRARWRAHRVNLRHPSRQLRE